MVDSGQRNARTMTNLSNRIAPREAITEDSVYSDAKWKGSDEAEATQGMPLTGLLDASADGSRPEFAVRPGVFRRKSFLNSQRPFSDEERRLSNEGNVVPLTISSGTASAQKTAQMILLIRTTGVVPRSATALKRGAAHLSLRTCPGSRIRPISVVAIISCLRCG
jgi:hypothetical protein